MGTPFGRTDSTWRDLGSVRPEALADARVNLHYAAQIASGVGRTWVQASADDSHTSLSWLNAVGGLSGAFAPRDPRCALAIDFARFRLVLLDGRGGILQALDLAGATIDDGYRWALERLRERWGDDIGDFAPVSYALPDDEIGRGGRFRRQDPEAFREWTWWFGGAAALLEETRREWNGSPVRCWPHHFDLATLIALEGDRSIGVGLSPGDDTYSEPYWYVGPWPRPDPAVWPRLEIGGWHTEGFVAAVLLAQELLDAADRQSLLKRFLESAIRESRRLLDAG